MTWWLWVRSPVEAFFLSGVFSPLTSAEACEKSSRWLWKEKLCYYWCEKARKHICVTKLHDMTLVVKVALNPNTTNLSLSYNVFNSYVSFVCQPVALCGYGLANQKLTKWRCMSLREQETFMGIEENFGNQHAFSFSALLKHLGVCKRLPKWSFTSSTTIIDVLYDF